jgi:hypothetical protein
MIPVLIAGCARGQLRDDTSDRSAYLNGFGSTPAVASVAALQTAYGSNYWPVRPTLSAPVLPASHATADVQPVAAAPAARPEPVALVAVATERAPRTRREPPSTPGGYAHADDYTWLCGEVQRSFGGARVRFAAVDEVDRYGGSVTLLPDAQVNGLQDGQRVRVCGQLVSPDNHVSAPPYRVLSVEPLDR